MAANKVVPIENRIPKLKEQRKQKANRRFIIYITLFFLLILIVIYLNSPLSLIGSISVKGNHYVSTKEILTTSKISRSTHIWDVHSSQLQNHIKTIPAISSVHMKRVFPNKLIITVHEYRRIAYLKNEKGYVPILENGSFLPNLQKGSIPINAPILVHWQKGKVLNQFAKKLSECKPEILTQISEFDYTPIKDDDQAITLYMNDGNKVLADINNFDKKIVYYPEILASLNKGDKGIVDMRIGMRFTPYAKSEVVKSENK